MTVLFRVALLGIVRCGGFLRGSSHAHRNCATADQRGPERGHEDRGNSLLADIYELGLGRILAFVHAVRRLQRTRNR